MLKFHIIIIKFSIFTNKNSQSDTFFPKLKNTIVKIDIDLKKFLRAEILQNFCSPHFAELMRKNGQQNFCKISVRGKIYAEFR